MDDKLIRPAEGETPLTWPEKDALLAEVTTAVGGTADTYVYGKDRVLDGILSRDKGGYYTLTTDDLQVLIGSAASTATMKDAARIALRKRGVPLPVSLVPDTEQSRRLRKQLTEEVREMKRDGIIPMPLNDPR